MSIIRANRTQVTPEVILDMDKHQLAISGECYPENPLPFFQPIAARLQQYLAEHKPAQFDAHMHLQYVNSASTKGLQNIVAILNEAGNAGTVVNVHWQHDPEDDALEELGQDLVEDFQHIVLHKLAVAA